MFHWSAGNYENTPTHTPDGIFPRSDMESVDALIRGIQEYKGGVVLVSHDARLIAATECELWVCEGGGRVRREENEKY